MSRFKRWIKPKIKHKRPTIYGWVVWHPENLYLGENTDIGYGTLINAQYGVRIEPDVQIGPHVTITSANTINDEYGPVIIKKGARIGAYALILPNVLIEENEFVKAYSVRK